MSQVQKTNALRQLENEGVQHSIYTYDAADGKIDGMSVAEKIGKAPELVYKTLVTVGKAAGIIVFVVPVEFALDLKKAAIASGEKSIEMIKARDLEPQTGYVHGGCSPVGMKKAFPTYIEETASLYETIVVSAGRVGTQVELSPGDLALVTGAVFADLVS